MVISHGTKLQRSGCVAGLLLVGVLLSPCAQPAELDDAQFVGMWGFNFRFDPGSYYIKQISVTKREPKDRRHAE
jgi:hypothetical protein